MPRYADLVTSALALALLILPAGAQDIPLVPLVPPALGDKEDAGALDLTGTWEYATSNHQGGCPGSHAGFPMSGLMDIAQTGGALAMELVSGANCDPAETCSFTGEIADGDLILWNAVSIEEGGKVTNTLQISFINADTGQGVGGAIFVYKDMQCGWSWNILMHRPEIDEDGTWVPGAAQGAD